MVFNFVSESQQEVDNGHTGLVHTVEYSPLGERYATGTARSAHGGRRPAGKTNGPRQAVEFKQRQ